MVLLCLAVCKVFEHSGTKAKASQLCMLSWFYLQCVSNAMPSYSSRARFNTSVVLLVPLDSFSGGSQRASISIASVLLMLFNETFIIPKGVERIAHEFLFTV